MYKASQEFGNILCRNNKKLVLTWLIIVLHMITRDNDVRKIIIKSQSTLRRGVLSSLFALFHLDLERNFYGNYHQIDTRVNEIAMGNALKDDI